MALEFLKGKQPGLKADEVDFGRCDKVSGTFRLWIDKYPAEPGVFLYLGQSLAGDSGISIGVDSTIRGAIFAEVSHGGTEDRGITDVEVQRLMTNRWYDIGWTLLLGDNHIRWCLLYIGSLKVAQFKCGVGPPETHLWSRIALGNKHDIHPSHYAVGVMQNLVIDLDDKPFLQYHLDSIKGQPQTGDEELHDLVNNHDLVTGPGLTYSHRGPKPIVPLTPDLIGNPHSRRR